MTYFNLANMPSGCRCCVEEDTQAAGVAAKRLSRRLRPDLTRSLLSLRVNARRIRIEAGTVCALAHGRQNKRLIVEVRYAMPYQPQHGVMSGSAHID
jgi:hypothetical protein